MQARLHRLHAAKREVVIYDYVDAAEPLLAKMAERREAGYRALGYGVTHVHDLFSRETALPINKTAESAAFCEPRAQRPVRERLRAWHAV
jgi:hypothetical protein